MNNLGNPNLFPIPVKITRGTPVLSSVKERHAILYIDFSCDFFPHFLHAFLIWSNSNTRFQMYDSTKRHFSRMLTTHFLSPCSVRSKLNKFENVLGGLGACKDMWLPVHRKARAESCIGNNLPPTLEQTGRHDWKQYLAATSLANGNKSVIRFNDIPLECIVTLQNGFSSVTIDLH